MEFIHSVLASDEEAEVGTVPSYDLPVNPLSHILITLKYVQTAAAASTVPVFTDILAVMSKIEVLFKGSAIFSMSGIDAFAAGLLVAGFESWAMNQRAAALCEKSLTWCIPLGRILYNERECFPRSTRGELMLQITYAAAWANFTTVNCQIETVELPDAAPEQFLRMTTLSRTITAEGEHDIELPIGNDISELILFGAVIPCDDVDLATVNYVQILVDNVRRFYSHTNIETLHNMAGRMRAAPGYFGDHVHWSEAVTSLTDPVLPMDHILSNYVHVPFDIFRDGRYILETAGKADVIVRVHSSLDAAGALRVIPCEIVKAVGGV